MGLPVTAQHIISSRDALIAALPDVDQRAEFLQLMKHSYKWSDPSANANSELFDTARGFVFGQFWMGEDDQALLNRVCCSRCALSLLATLMSVRHIRIVFAEPLLDGASDEGSA